jgi:hypothetical protein
VIRLYRPAEGNSNADIEEALREMVIAHEVIIVDANQIPDSLPPETQLPVLSDGSLLITGRADIEAHLKVLEQFVADWRRFQADACYLDDDGEMC